MPKGGKNHAQEGEKSLRGGGISRAQAKIILPPPLTNFSSTPLCANFTKFDHVLWTKDFFFSFDRKHGQKYQQ